MTESIAQSIASLNAHWALLLVWTLAFLEACPGIGLFITGALLLATATGLYANGVVELPHIMFFAFLGASISDHLGYYIGRWLGPRFHHSRFARKHHKRVEHAEALFKKHGAAAIVIGRLIPAIRSITPLFTGISRVSTTRFSLVDFFACGVWAIGLGALSSGITLALN